LQAVLDNDAGWLPPFSCFSHRSEERRKPQTTVVYLVRSSRAYARIRSLTTGTFNRVVKDRIAFRLSGAYSISPDSHKCESDCPRNRYNHTVRRRLRQRERPTEFPPDFHMGKALIGRRTAIQTAFAARNSMVFRLNLTNADIPARELFRHAQRRKTKN